MDFNGKVAIVTGASSGIGWETALEFARRSAVVVGVARREERLGDLMEKCAELSPASSYIAGDLGERGFAEGVIARTVERHGRLDILVNNAGMPIHRHIYEVSTDDFERVMRVNFLSCMWATMAAIPHMLMREEAYIVNVSSFATRVAPPRETAYTASKAAMDGFTEGLWSDLAGSNIHAALIWPGPIDTEIWGKDDSPNAYAGTRHPPKMVADAVVEAIEKKRYQLTAPSLSPQLLSARFLRLFLPSLLRAGMAWMEPVEPEVVEKARREARERLAGG